MRTLVVLSKNSNWPMETPGVEIVSARDYLTDATWTKARGIRVFNLCDSYRYQSEGYYVSLLAAARKHRPFPALMTVLDMKSRAIVRTLDDELVSILEKSLESLRSDRFELSIYFGRNIAKRHDALARRLFSQFPAPLLRAVFVRGERWRLSKIAPIALRDVPEPHHELLHEAAVEYFSRPRFRSRATQPTRFDLAILHDPAEVLAPSDEKALARFRRAGEKLGLDVEMIQREDYGRLGEFDGLFVRETTAVNHHTFRFSQRAEAEGLVVIDDPQSILRCGNKVFQSEVLEVNGVPTPKTWITTKPTAEEVEQRIGFPCILKFPDSAFSLGVFKCENAAELEVRAAGILEVSDLLLVQQYTPSEYDWRIGILDGKALYACRYHMARGHWQIVKQTSAGRYRYGKSDTIPLEDTPDYVLKTALQAAHTIGDGLYGVDLKEIDGRATVIEINDNPNIDAGSEDALLKDELYLTIMRVFLERIEAKKSGEVR